MRVSGRAGAWGAVAVVASLSVVAAATSACNAPAASPRSSPSTAAVHQVVTTSPADIPPGVLPRSAILARFQNTRPGVTTEAKLVSLADLAAASKGELTQCQFRGCPPGALVWLVLQQGPPGTFPDSGPRQLTNQESAVADAWSLFPVDATTGQSRGDSEVGALGQLSSSPWGQLRDLDPAH